MSIQIGDSLPSVAIRKVTPDGSEVIQTGDYFKGRKIVLFAVVGAYTGTCNNQLPTYIENADAIQSKGVDEIACLAVNDPIVMGAWAKAMGSEGKITMLADWNADFSKAADMTFDGSGAGLGVRSLRYTAVVDDGKVTALEVEESPGACSVTNGENILASLS